MQIHALFTSSLILGLSALPASAQESCPAQKAQSACCQDGAKVTLETSCCEKSSSATITVGKIIADEIAAGAKCSAGQECQDGKVVVATTSTSTSPQIIILGQDGTATDCKIECEGGVTVLQLGAGAPQVIDLKGQFEGLDLSSLGIDLKALTSGEHQTLIISQEGSPSLRGFNYRYVIGEPGVLQGKGIVLAQPATDAIQILETLEAPLAASTAVFEFVDGTEGVEIVELSTQDDDRGYIGIYLGNEDGKVTIDSILPGGAAQAAGLEAGDVLLEIDGKSAAETDALMAHLQTLKAGKKIKIKVDRNGWERNVKVELAPAQKSWNVSAEPQNVRFGSGAGGTLQRVEKSGDWTVLDSSLGALEHIDLKDFNVEIAEGDEELHGLRLHALHSALEQDGSSRGFFIHSDDEEGDEDHDIRVFTLPQGRRLQFGGDVKQLKLRLHEDDDDDEHSGSIVRRFRLGGGEGQEGHGEVRTHARIIINGEQFDFDGDDVNVKVQELLRKHGHDAGQFEFHLGNDDGQDHGSGLGKKRGGGKGKAKGDGDGQAKSKDKTKAKGKGKGDGDGQAKSKDKSKAKAKAKKQSKAKSKKAKHQGHAGDHEVHIDIEHLQGLGERLRESFGRHGEHGNMELHFEGLGDRVREQIEKHLHGGEGQRIRIERLHEGSDHEGLRGLLRLRGEDLHFDGDAIREHIQGFLGRRNGGGEREHPRIQFRMRGEGEHDAPQRRTRERFRVRELHEEHGDHDEHPEHGGHGEHGRDDDHGDHGDHGDHDGDGMRNRIEELQHQIDELRHQIDELQGRRNNNRRRR